MSAATTDAGYRCTSRTGVAGIARPRCQLRPGPVGTHAADGWEWADGQAMPTLAPRAIAEGRAEPDDCQRSTPGCAIDHDAERTPGPCETW